MDKQITLEEAAALVQPGCMLALGGLTLYRRPLSFARALLNRHHLTGTPSGITLLTYTAGLESDLLVGKRIVNRVRTCYFGLEIFGLAPMFTYFASRGEIEIIEETEASLAFGLRAQAANVGFMPGRGWLGTDLPRLRPDVHTILDPYTGEELIAFPAIQPDIAIIHGLIADFDGNVQIGKNKGVDEELAITSKMVIVTAEEIVPELDSADITAPFVDAIVNSPRGALPTSCHPRYPLDGVALLDYTERVSDPESFEKYLQSMPI